MDSEEETFYDDDVVSEDESNESSEDDVGFPMEIKAEKPREGSIDVDDYPYEVLSTEEIVRHMDDCITEVNGVVEIPATTTRILLSHFKWDKEKLMERFYDGDQEKLFSEAQVVNPFRQSHSINKTRSQSSLSRKPSINGTEECGICFVNFPCSMMTGLECGHRYCTGCWGEYLTTKIIEEGVGQTIPCAAHKCNILVDDAIIMELITDTKVKLRYQQLITNSFVQYNRLLRWCPSPFCNNAIKVQSLESRPVCCKCGHIFCFQCGENWHNPVKCHQLRSWMKKCSDDSETLNWITANTKECPNCDVTIEKNGGCNHMVCKNLNCRAEFCWVCLGPWGVDGYNTHNCNRYEDETKAQTSNYSQSKCRTALQRYLFYYTRYANHMESLKFENNLYASVEEKMKELQQYNMSWIEVQFLKKAVDILCSCRQTLMYTYPFAFFLQKNNQSVIFEDNQKDLESATECLSEYLERDITSENLVGIKQKVQDKSRYCDSRRKALLEHVYEGYDNEWWEYLD